MLIVGVAQDEHPQPEEEEEEEEEKVHAVMDNLAIDPQI